MPYIISLLLIVLVGCSGGKGSGATGALAKCSYNDMLVLANAAAHQDDPHALDADEAKQASPSISSSCRAALSSTKVTRPLSLAGTALYAEKKMEEGLSDFLDFVTDDALSKTVRKFPLASLDDLIDPKTKSTPAIGAPIGTPIREVIDVNAIADEKVRLLVEKGAAFGDRRIPRIPMKGDERVVEVALVPFPSASESDGVKCVDVGSIPDGNFLIYLPKDYMVATGSSIHRELYPHDTSYVIESLVRMPSVENLAHVRSMLDNFAYQTKMFGFPLNGNRGYYLTRSQTNNIPTNIVQYYEAATKLGLEGVGDWLREAGLPMALAIHAYWQSGDGVVDLGEGMKGNRWIAHGAGPCQEVWESHGVHKAYYFRALDELVKLEGMPDAQRPDYAKGFDYARVVNRLDAKAAKNVREEAAIEGSSGLEGRMYILPAMYSSSGKDEPVIKREDGKYYTFTPFYYVSDRASRVSGYDSNHLYGPFNAFTLDFIPVAHNVQLYRHENDIVRMLKAYGRFDEAEEWKKRAEERKEMIFATMWDDGEGMLFEYDAEGKRLRTNYPFASSAYAIWARIFDPTLAEERAMLMRMVNYIEKHLEGPNGLYASGVTSGLHWDKPFSWPIQQGMVVAGLREYAEKLQKIEAEIAQKLTDLADRISLKYLKANYRNWLRSKGKEIPEKVGPDKGVFTGYENQANYTWNLAAVWDLQKHLSEKGKRNFNAYIEMLNAAPPKQ